MLSWLLMRFLFCYDVQKMGQLRQSALHTLECLVFNFVNLGSYIMISPVTILIVLSAQSGNTKTFQKAAASL